MMMMMMRRMKATKFICLLTYALFQRHGWGDPVFLGLVIEGQLRWWMFAKCFKKTYAGAPLPSSTMGRPWRTAISMGIMMIFQIGFRENLFVQSNKKIYETLYVNLTSSFSFTPNKHPIHPIKPNSGYPIITSTFITKTTISVGDDVSPIVGWCETLRHQAPSFTSSSSSWMSKNRFAILP